MFNPEVLGLKAEDSISTYKGTIRAIGHFDTGCVHIGLLKPGLDKNEEPYKIQWFDLHTIKCNKPLTIKSPEGLGKNVVDERTGFKGRCIDIIEWLDSDARVSIQGKHLHEGKPAKPHITDYKFVTWPGKDKTVKKTVKPPGASVHALRHEQ
jgi:hypothetical protein